MESKKPNAIVDKTFEFACEIVEFCSHLKNDRHFEIASQLIRSGTSVGANVREAQRAESKADFKHRLKISLKEADETKYWLELIDAKITTVDQKLFQFIDEIIRLLVSIIKNTSK